MIAQSVDVVETMCSSLSKNIFLDTFGIIALFKYASSGYNLWLIEKIEAHCIGSIRDNKISIIHNTKAPNNSYIRQLGTLFTHLPRTIIVIL